MINIFQLPKLFSLFPNPPDKKWRKRWILRLIIYGRCQILGIGYFEKSPRQTFQKFLDSIDRIIGFFYHYFTPSIKYKRFAKGSLLFLKGILRRRSFKISFFPSGYISVLFFSLYASPFSCLLPTFLVFDYPFSTQLKFLHLCGRFIQKTQK